MGLQKQLQHERRMQVHLQMQSLYVQSKVTYPSPQHQLKSDGSEDYCRPQPLKARRDRLKVNKLVIK